MEVNDWLEKFAPGFDQLSAQERGTIKDFLLLWSHFEGAVLETNGNAKAIIGEVASLKEQGKLTLAPFLAAIKYYSERYYDGQSFTHEFNGLRLRDVDQKPLVENVISGQSTDDAEILSAILIIVLRLRNNLVHGIKWSYGIAGQLENFKKANCVLMSFMTLRRP